jgi:CheY-like chemotaxis protein
MNKASSPQQQDAPPPAANAGGLRVLLVDDDPLLREALSQFLRVKGWTVALAEHGAEALELLQRSPFTAVVLDLIMPGMEGIETLTQIRRHYPRLPVIAISGGGRNDPECYLPMAITLGARRVLPKPFDPHQLNALLHEIIPPASTMAAP